MRLFRPRNLLILAIGGTVVAVLLSKKNRPADPLPTTSYSTPSASSTSSAADKKEATPAASAAKKDDDATAGTAKKAGSEAKAEAATEK